MIPCRDRAEHRLTSWAVLGREVFKTSEMVRSVSTPGISTLMCTECGVAWRSQAKYVAELPDLPEQKRRPQRKAVEDPRPAYIAQLVESHPRLAELTYWTENGALAGTRQNRPSPFLRDIARWLERRAFLTQPQIEAADDSILAHVESENDAQLARDALRTEQEVLGSRLAPQGSTTVVGTVQRAWEEQTEGVALVTRMEVLADDGYRVEGTVPMSIRRQVPVDELPGHRIELHAELYRDRKDLTLARARYPRQTSKVLS